MRKIQFVVSARPMKDIPEDEDFEYWQNQPVIERLRALTLIVSQSLKPGQRMDKSVVVKRRIKP